MSKLTVKDLDVKGKKVLIRVDFNVPLDDKLNITDDRRISEALPTIQYVLKQGASKVILMSHLGRPEGQVVEDQRLAPVGKHLEKLLGPDGKVLCTKDCIGDDVKKAVETSKERVILLENLRFHKAETKNDAEFAKKLASLADVFVNDAFGTAHRAHASTEGVTHYLKSAAGFLLEKEIKYLGQAIDKPAKPFVIILGGAKVSDKIALIENMLPKVDVIIIGGGMAYTFLRSQGKEIGTSLLEADKVPVAKDILEKAKKANVKIALSEDFVAVQNFKDPSGLKIMKDLEPGWSGVDIGPATRKTFKDILSTAKTVVWNGPVGVFEVKEYSDGTRELAEHLSKLKGVTSIVGGGDTAAAVAKFNCEEGITHISTGGGASLELLEGKVLPGIAALTDK
ncbi:MAG: phosphoglycerate kinase [Candidatus Omnitrophica bacterium]|nr:phosphoglycerate kinase [Candidatus Omnitrophota bacterium]